MSACVFKNKKEALSDIPQTFWELSAKDIHGEMVNFADYQGKAKAFIIVNVASACGLTNNNYRQLQKFHEQYHDQGLEIWGFPCNQFRAQENKCEADIEHFVKTKFKVDFKMFSKIEVNGEDCHPLYKYLRYNSPLRTSDGAIKEVPWNFGKFVLGSDGKVLRYYEPTTKPNEFREYIEALLK